MEGLVGRVLGRRLCGEACRWLSRLCPMRHRRNQTESHTVPEEERCSLDVMDRELIVPRAMFDLSEVRAAGYGSKWRVMEMPSQERRASGN